MSDILICRCCYLPACPCPESLTSSTYPCWEPSDTGVLFPPCWFRRHLCWVVSSTSSRQGHCKLGYLHRNYLNITHELYCTVLELYQRNLFHQSSFVRVCLNSVWSSNLWVYTCQHRNIEFQKIGPNYSCYTTFLQFRQQHRPLSPRYHSWSLPNGTSNPEDEGLGKSTDTSSIHQLPRSGLAAWRTFQMDGAVLIVPGPQICLPHLGTVQGRN